MGAKKIITEAGAGQERRTVTIITRSVSAANSPEATSHSSINQYRVPTTAARGANSSPVFHNSDYGSDNEIRERVADCLFIYLLWSSQRDLPAPTTGATEETAASESRESRTSVEKREWASTASGSLPRAHSSLHKSLRQWVRSVLGGHACPPIPFPNRASARYQIAAANFTRMQGMGGAGTV